MGHVQVHDSSEAVGDDKHRRACKAFLDSSSDLGVHPSPSAKPLIARRDTHSKSTDDVAVHQRRSRVSSPSSITRILARLSSARARQSNCRWPWLKLAPSTATKVSRFGAARRIFLDRLDVSVCEFQDSLLVPDISNVSLRLPEQRLLSWTTILSLPRSSDKVISDMSADLAGPVGFAHPHRQSR
jgi:hypothetical protein